MEDYLETITRLNAGGGPVGVTAIGNAMHVKKPSVFSALAKLSEAGFVVHEKYGDVKLTKKGERLARDVYRRHRTIRHFLIDVLYVDPDTAENEACRMEHVLSNSSISRLGKFTDYLLDLHSGVHRYLDDFHRHLERGKLTGKLREIHGRHKKDKT